MPEIGRLVDALGLFLTGGADNTDPDLSLGGACSSTRFRGLGALISDPIPAIRIDNVYPACGEGEATLEVDGDGNLVFTPPGGSAGAPVPIAAGESKVLTGTAGTKAIRVSRRTGFDFEGNSGLSLLYSVNGVLGQKNVTDAQRQAGVTTYRAILLKAQGAYGVCEIRLWLPPVAGAQATFSLALETPMGDTIQTIANETTAPGGVSWVTPTDEGSALEIPVIDVGKYHGLWIRRVFPPGGTVAALENVQLSMKYKGA